MHFSIFILFSIKAIRLGAKFDKFRLSSGFAEGQYGFLDSFHAILFFLIKISFPPLNLPSLGIANLISELAD